MRRFAILMLVLSALGVAAIPSAAQNGPRVQPIVIDASDNNDVSDAYQFQANSQLIVNGVNSATNEAGEPVHTCVGGAGTRSVWFTTRLMPGTVTLSTSGSSYTTAGGTSANTVISLYRMTNFVYSGFGDLESVACNDNGAGAGIISSVVIPSSAIYYIRVSAAPGVTVNGAPSQVVLTATVTNDQPFSHDEPSSAKKLKFVGLPGILNVYNATRSLDEPVDPFLSEPITNTAWFKFTITSPRIVGFQNFYDAGNIWFSLFQKSGPDYIPAAGHVEAYDNNLTAHLDAGTYFLRVGSLSDARGTSSFFTTFIAPLYLLPDGYSFAVPGTEGTADSEPSLAGWKVKKGDPGPNGDIVVCDEAPMEYCKFQLASSGPTEKTALKAKLNVNAAKVKKGDVLQLLVTLGNMVGTPKFDVILKLTSPNGASQKYVLKVQTDSNNSPVLTMPIPKTMAVSKVALTIKNKDVVPGNKVEIDSVVAAALRIGEGVFREQPLTLALGGTLSPAWQTGTAAPEGLLPAPPPPAN